MSNIPITEQIYTSKKQIDHLGNVEAFNIILKDQLSFYQAIKKNKNIILKLVNFLTKHLSDYKNSRLVYCGAGTSGRIGVQDGVELPPTFGWSYERIDFIIAGGEKALLKSIENSVDDIEQAKFLFKKKKITQFDIVICIAASGNTIFTNEILELCKQKKVKTIAISNNPKGKILKKADYKIILDTKQEVIAGSTRLKAGTAQKICLNLISTLVMTNLGHVRDGMMINLKPNNKKLRDRLKRIKNSLDENSEIKFKRNYD